MMNSFGGEKIRLLLADDHAIVRAGLRALLDAARDVEVAGEAATAEEAVSACAAMPVDLGKRPDRRLA